jgi:hypothetical protein
VGGGLPDDYMEDDGTGGIVVYHNRREQVAHGLTGLLLAGASAALAAGAFLPPPAGANPGDPPIAFAVYGPGAGVSGVAALISFIRALRHRPALIVNPYGILDRCSQDGRRRQRLLRWDEIASVGCEVAGNQDLVMQTLVINVFTTPAEAARAELNVIPSPIAPHPFTTSTVVIRQGDLDMSVIELAYAIELYITVYKPEGWHGRLSDARHELVKATALPELPPAEELY